MKVYKISELDEKFFNPKWIKDVSFKEFKTKVEHWMSVEPTTLFPATEKDIAQLYEKLTGKKSGIKETAVTDKNDK